jgi:hypothetical protein
MQTSGSARLRGTRPPLTGGGGSRSLLPWDAVPRAQMTSAFPRWARSLPAGLAGSPLDLGSVPEHGLL